MRRFWWSRALSATLSLWLVLSWGEAALVHVCPMHGRVEASAPSHGGSADSHAHATHDSASSSSDDDSGQCLCTCIGVCCASGAPALLPVLADVVVSATGPAAPSRPASAYALRRAPGAHVLPFANGPPVRLS